MRRAEVVGLQLTDTADRRVGDACLLVNAEFPQLSAVQRVEEA